MNSVGGLNSLGRECDSAVPMRLFEFIFDEQKQCTQVRVTSSNRATLMRNYKIVNKNFVVM